MTVCVAPNFIGCVAGAPARENWLSRCGGGIPSGASSWVAQRFSAAISDSALSGALAPEGEHAQ